MPFQGCLAKFIHSFIHLKLLKANNIYFFNVEGETIIEQLSLPVFKMVVFSSFYFIIGYFE